jgi:hypothetical protein
LESKDVAIISANVISLTTGKRPQQMSPNAGHNSSDELKARIEKELRSFKERENRRPPKWGWMFLVLLAVSPLLLAMYLVLANCFRYNSFNSIAFAAYIGGGLGYSVILALVFRANYVFARTCTFPDVWDVIWKQIGGKQFNFRLVLAVVIAGPLCSGLFGVFEGRTEGWVLEYERLIIGGIWFVGILIWATIVFWPWLRRRKPK